MNKRQQDGFQAYRVRETELFEIPSEDRERHLPWNINGCNGLRNSISLA